MARQVESVGILTGNDAVTYNHGDLVGSTMYRATFDQQGQPTATQQVTYTAFGEPVVADGGGGWNVGGELPAGMGRYGYVGGHGYESGMIALYGENSDLPAVTLVHVGERWYEPGTGRFVQRDPIGLRGGVNVYGYCGGQPLARICPSGLDGPTGFGSVKKIVEGERTIIVRKNCAPGGCQLYRQRQVLIVTYREFDGRPLAGGSSVALGAAGLLLLIPGVNVPTGLGFAFCLGSAGFGAVATFGADEEISREWINIGPPVYIGDD